MAEGTSAGLVESVLQLPEKFATVASQSPEQAVLLALGVLITGFSVVAFGALTVGGILDVIAGLLPSGEPPRQPR